MHKKTYLKNVVFMMALFFSITINAQSTEGGNPTQSWMIAHDYQGIKVLCSTYEFAGETYLELKFENTSDQSKEFSWSLMIKENTYNSNKNIKLEAMKSVMVKDEETLIPFKNNNHALTSINLNFK